MNVIDDVSCHALWEVEILSDTKIDWVTILLLRLRTSECS